VQRVVLVVEFVERGEKVEKRGEGGNAFE